MRPVQSGYTMPTLAPEPTERPKLIGRSSSHFTRITRIFARELGVDHSFEVVRDLMALQPAAYATNPALRLPILETPAGTWFGALNICRQLQRQSPAELAVVWPEDLEAPVLANAQELALQAMATEVALIMMGLAGGGGDDLYQAKLSQSLRNTMDWLDAQIANALTALPKKRDLSFLEVTLFCLTTHLEFRGVLPTRGYRNLTKFCRSFEERPSVGETPYAFDQ